jgi:hypothetical protein
MEMINISGQKVVEQQFQVRKDDLVESVINMILKSAGLDFRNYIDGLSGDLYLRSWGSFETDLKLGKPKPNQISAFITIDNIRKFTKDD